MGQLRLLLKTNSKFQQESLLNMVHYILLFLFLLNYSGVAMLLVLFYLKLLSQN